MKFFRKKYVRYTLLSLLGIFLLGVVWYFEFIIYGIGQVRGQLNIVWNTQTYQDFLSKSDYPDTTKQKFKQKLDLIREIKNFAVKELGLSGTSNYERVYDQKNKAILWAVTACEPFELKPKEWDYAFLGKMPYKGYFDSTRAYTLKNNLEKEGYDVGIYAPSAWSTLGWLSDPVLSNMLYWNEGALASLIIHEMTHGTVWVYGGVEYNENLADFIGERGAKLFLIYKYGKDSKQYERFLRELSDEERGFQYILKSTQKLDSLYQTFTPNLPTQDKIKRKEACITEIVKGFGELGLLNSKRLKKWLKKLPNNAFFMNYRRYRGKQDLFERECKEKYKDNIKTYLAYLKKQYPA